MGAGREGRQPGGAVGGGLWRVCGALDKDEGKPARVSGCLGFGVRCDHSATKEGDPRREIQYSLGCSFPLSYNSQGGKQQKANTQAM